MNLGASMQKVEQEMKARLNAAEKDVERISNTWEGSGFPGQFKITLENASDGSIARAALKEAIEYADDKAKAAVMAALDYAVSAAVWGWRDGSRDIVDTGELRNSLSFIDSANGFGFYYDAPYAALVHYGGYVKPYGNPNIDAVYIPGRPWVDAVLFGGGPVQKVDLDSIYDDAIIQAFR